MNRSIFIFIISIMWMVGCSQSRRDSVFQIYLNGIRNTKDYIEIRSRLKDSIQTNAQAEDALNSLHNNSKVISIDDDKIQTDIQNARDASVSDESGNFKVENQVYIYLDLKEAKVTSTPGAPGDNGSTEVVYTPLSNGTNQAVDKDANRIHYSVLVAQAHSHPDTDQPGKKTLSEMSPRDQNTSNDLHIAIYGIDAMSGSGAKGAAANINRANPNGSKPTNNVGQTKGPGPSTFNIGKQALEMWSGNWKY